MAIFDIFKKKKKEPPEPEKKEKKQKPEKIKKPVDEQIYEATKPKPAKKIEKRQFSDAYRILQSTHVTEKSAKLSEQGSYVFKVKPQANKPEIKKAIQDLYGVKVEKVMIINIPKKPRRLGKSQGFRSGYKKAIVKLVEGEKIETMPR